MQISKFKNQNDNPKFKIPREAGYQNFAFFILHFTFARKRAGFTLIEALVGIAALILVGAAVWNFQKDVMSLSGIFQSDLGIQQEVRKVVKVMSAEIRSSSISSTGAYPIAEAGSTSFTFYADVDDDGLKERIRYFLAGSIIQKGVLKPSGNPLTYNPANETVSDVVHDIANGASPIFEYFDSSYDGTTPPLSQPVDVSAVRLVRITVMADRYPSRPPGPITVTTQVAMRNLKDNL